MNLREKDSDVKKKEKKRATAITLLKSNFVVTRYMFRPQKRRWLY
jgi:hypothetical protein